MINKKDVYIIVLASLLVVSLAIQLFSLKENIKEVRSQVNSQVEEIKKLNAGVAQIIKVFEEHDITCDNCEQ